ncbi:MULTISPECIES: hypothetical protein [unclassified Mesorhizobium]|nr:MULTISPECIES: hypothetical protein [unclassified Mesorhizobium]
MVLLNTLREVTAKEVEAQDISAHVGMTADAIERNPALRFKRKPG